MKRAGSTAFGIFAALGAAAGAAAPATAWSVRQNGAFCMSDKADNVSNGGNYTQNDSTTALARLTCPVLDTSAMPKTGATALSVLVVDKSTTASVDAYACVQLATLPGGRCGAPASTSVAGTGGPLTLSPARTQWTGAADFPYIFVSVPPKVGASTSGVLGYTFSG